MSIWLLSRFVHINESYDFEFVSVGESIYKNKKNSDETYINVDTGDSIFDHHKTNDYVCAASIIMDHYDLSKDEAIHKMVNYTLKVDHGLAFETDVSDFHLLNIMEGLNAHSDKSSDAVMRIALNMLDGVYYGIKQKEVAESEINRLLTFETRWGRAAAIETTNRKTRFLAHKIGFKIFVYVDPKSGYRGFTADGRSDVDFKSVYDKVTTIEPNADWFLHSSKQLLLCGSSKAPDKRKSNLSLNEMIELIRKK
jgi:hypothetical protein